jgi:hypothetical protein
MIKNFCPPEARAEYRSHCRSMLTACAAASPHRRQASVLGKTPSAMRRRTRRSTVAADSKTGWSRNSSSSGTTTRRPQEQLSAEPVSFSATERHWPHSQYTPRAIAHTRGPETSGRTPCLFACGPCRYRPAFCLSYLRRPAPTRKGPRARSSNAAISPSFLTAVKRRAIYLAVRCVVSSVKVCKWVGRVLLRASPFSSFCSFILFPLFILRWGRSSNGIASPPERR